MESFLTGWIAVAALALAFAMVAAAACVIAMRGLFSTVAVIALSLPTIGLLATSVFGDISRYFPARVFADGFEGLNQIVAASALSSILGGITLSAAAVSLIVRLLAAVQAISKVARPTA